MNQKNWFSLLREYKVLVGIIITGLFLIEFEIFSFAAMSSGKQPRLQVLNNSGRVVYEIKGSTLANFNKERFEKTFGPFENYQVKLTEKNIPFPFRAWFSAAIGVPVGLVLLLAFVLKAAMVFIYGGEENTENNDDPEYNKKNQKTNRDKGLNKPYAGYAGIEKLLMSISRFNIFIIGFLVICMVFLLWMIPNTLNFLAKVGIDTILRFKWVFSGGIIALFILFAWFMYMKYKLAKKMIDADTEIRKYELQLEYKKLNNNQLPEIDDNRNGKTKMLEYTDENYSDNDLNGNLKEKS